MRVGAQRLFLLEYVHAEIVDGATALPSNPCKLEKQVHILY